MLERSETVDFKGGLVSFTINFFSDGSREFPCLACEAPMMFSAEEAAALETEQAQCDELVSNELLDNKERTEAAQRVLQTMMCNKCRADVRKNVARRLLVAAARKGIREFLYKKSGDDNGPQ